MRRPVYAVLILTLTALIITGCASKPATAVSFGEVCDAKNDHQRLSTVGYFDPGVAITCSSYGGDYRCGMEFHESPGSDAKFTADLLEGNGRNQMPELPDSYTNDDVKIKSDDGTLIGVGQKARISGEMLIGEGVCLMTVDKIEAASE